MKGRNGFKIRYIIIGVLIGVSLLAGQYFHCLHMWNHDYKAQAFASLSEYFFSVSKGTVLLALALMIVFIGAGILDYLIGDQDKQ